MIGAALPVILAGLGGAAIAVALREGAAVAAPLLEALREAGEALALAGRENRSPSERERHRLGLLAGFALGLLAVLATGFGALAALAAAGPAAAGALIARRRRRYRLRVERDIPALAAAIADAVAAGASLRGALLDAAAGLSGPTAVEMARVASDLELGMSIRAALAALGERIGSPRLDALIAAVLSQERVGGDLPALLRRHGRAAASRRVAEREARSATAQARLTGGMVVAMPLIAGLGVELVAPGFLAGIARNPVALLLLMLAGALQLGGFLAIRRLGRVDG